MAEVDINFQQLVSPADIEPSVVYVLHDNQEYVDQIKDAIDILTFLVLKRMEGKGSPSAIKKNILGKLFP